MKKVSFIVFSSLLAHLCVAQNPCFPTPTGVFAGDEPPGCEICGPIYLGNTGGFTADTLGLDFPCGTIDGNQWLTIRADSTGKLIFSALISGCSDGSFGIQMAVYDMNLNRVSNCFSDGGGIGLPGSFNVRDLIPGEQYLIMVDPFVEGGSCEFFLTFSAFGVGEANIDNPEPIKSSPDRNLFCSPNRAVFSIPRVDSATAYQWSVPGGVEIMAGGGVLDTFVMVMFETAVSGNIRVRPFRGCWGSAPENFQFWAESRDTSLSVVICPGEQFETGGSIFDSSGTYTVVVNNLPPFECDSTIRLELKIPDTSGISIECVQDSFLQTLDFTWDKKPLAEEYQIFINDSLVRTQSHAGYIYKPSFSNEEIKIAVKPVGRHGCAYAPGKITCIGPSLSSSVNRFRRESISVFPNPSSGMFEIFSKERIVKTEVSDVSGRVFKTVFDTKIDLYDSGSGIYFLKIFVGEKVVLRKVLKI